MPDWNRIVGRFFALSDPENEYDHYVGPGASPDKIKSVQTELGILFPAEFHKLYRRFNGIGLTDREEPGHMPLFLRSIGEMPNFVEQCRLAFVETHPQEAEQYFPFIDWWNGDSSGYWLRRDGKPEPYVFTFSHERYMYEIGQDVAEFIQPHFDSIADLLSPD